MIDSPEFKAVFVEAVDACFQALYLDLHNQLFSSAPEDYVSHISGIHMTAPSLVSYTQSSYNQSYRQALSTPVKNSSSQSGLLKSPPLARVLPQLKAVALKLFPAPVTTGSSNVEPYQLVSSDVREVSSGAYLEAFCLAIFDATVPS